MSDECCSFDILFCCSYRDFFNISIIVAYRSKKMSVFHVLTMLITLSLIDTFLPAVLWINLGANDLAPLLKPFTNGEIAVGILYYFLFYIILIGITLYASKANTHNFIESFNTDYQYLRSNLDLFIIIAGAMFSAGLINEIVSYGGLSQWLFYKFTIRFDPFAKDRNALEVLLKTVPWRSLFSSLCFVGFLLRHRLCRPVLYGRVVPVVGILFALSISFRGSILVFLLGLFFVEHIRIYIHKKITMNRNSESDASHYLK